MKQTISLSQLQSRLKGPAITRFAPAPTGHLHLGHILSLLYVYAAAKACEATLLLRIEDHDRGRSREEYEQSILADIDWLGVPFSNRHAYFKQSTLLPSYAAALDTLSTATPLYSCDCTRKQLLQQNAMQGGELHYPGNCRHRALPEGPERGLRMHLTKETLHFDDLIQGPQEQCAAEQCGDLLLRDRHGNYTYNFAVAVDDMAQGVNLIVRGADLLHCTARQLQLRQALGAQEPITFVHHPLIHDSNGQKLSKRFFADAVASRREQGERPEAVIGAALAHIAILPRAREISLDEAAELLIGD